MADLGDYRRKRDPKRTPEPFGGDASPDGADLRDPAPRRAAAPLRPAARAGRRARELGRAEGPSVPGRRAPPRGARRGSPARLRDLRGRHPRRASTARARSRSGIAAPTSSSRRSAAAASRSVSTASGPRASGRSSRRASTGTSATGCSSGRTRRPRRRRRSARSSPSSPSGSRRARAGSTSRSGTAIARSSRSPARRRRSRAATATTSPSASATSHARPCAPSARPRRCSTARSARSTRTAARGSRRSRAGPGGCVLMAFDLLVLDDEPVHTRPLAERREAARGAARPDRRRRPPLARVRGRGSAARCRSEAQGLEGVVAKRADAPYRPGRRTPEWQKVKLRAQEDFPIVGYTRGTGRRAKLGALVLGRREPDGLHWAGNVGSGLADDDVDAPARAPAAARRATSPLVDDAADAAHPRQRRDLGRAAARPPR